MTDYKQLCGELLNWLNGLYEEVIDAGVGCVPDEAQDLMNRAWDAMAESDGPAVPDGREPASVNTEPSGPIPADDEMTELATAEMVRQLRTKAATEKANRCHYSATLLTRAADLLAQRQPQPVSVRELLPYDSERNAKGECWWLNPGDDETGPFWCLYEGPRNLLLEGITHWLPANALPLPQPF